MAGDWIKMRIDLQSHPKIVRILSATKSDKFRVIGGLHAVWSVFDTHSENGELQGYTPETMDHIIGWDGFSKAMLMVGWLTFDGAETLAMPDFDEHNGKSAKRRAEDQKRKRDGRKQSESIPEDCGQIADKKRTREEKRREEKKEPIKPTPIPPSRTTALDGFDQFWAAYPKKVGKAAAEKAWRKIKRPTETLETILHVLSWQTESQQWRKNGGQFIPNPATYLNEGRWQDERPSDGFAEFLGCGDFIEGEFHED